MRGIVLAAVAIVALAGCGGGSSNKSGSSSTSTPTNTPTASPTAASGGSSGGGNTLSLAADKSKLAYDKKTLSAKAGKVTIDMTNPSSIPHDIAIKGNGVQQVGKVVSSGGTSTVTADLKPGTYTFYCSVDGHEAAGMKGTLTVK
jgi:plastocyanin